MRRPYLAIAVLAAVALLAITGCGGGGSTTSTASGGSEGGETESAESSETSGTASKAGAGEEAGYGGAESGNEGEGAEQSRAGGATTVAVVKVMNTPKLGKVIVDAEGMTLYDFHKDKGTTSTCYGECAKDWPPLLTSAKAKAMAGAQGSLVGTTKRKDGTTQVTYKGHPVYTFFLDKKPGETRGNDVDFFGGEWYALEPNGEEPDDS